jgi:hypothetical protein
MVIAVGCNVIMMVMLMHIAQESNLHCLLVNRAAGQAHRCGNRMKRQHSD